MNYMVMNKSKRLSKLPSCCFTVKDKRKYETTGEAYFYPLQYNNGHFIKYVLAWCIKVSIHVHTKKSRAMVCSGIGLGKHGGPSRV